MCWALFEVTGQSPPWSLQPGKLGQELASEPSMASPVTGPGDPSSFTASLTARKKRECSVTFQLSRKHHSRPASIPAPNLAGAGAWLVSRVTVSPPPRGGWTHLPAGPAPRGWPGTCGPSSLTRTRFLKAGTQNFSSAQS